MNGSILLLNEVFSVLSLKCLWPYLRTSFLVISDLFPLTLNRFHAMNDLCSLTLMRQRLYSTSAEVAAYRYPWHSDPFKRQMEQINT